MHVSKGAVAGGASLVLLSLAQAFRAAAALPLPAVEGDPEPPGYTFKVDVAMAMRHFPWLHFHVSGDGVFQPGVSYVVHFDQVPWFVPRQRHDADLSMLDPLMWPGHFTYEQIGEHNGQRIYALHSLDASLKSATVALGPRGRASKVDATYNDGTHLDMNVTSSDVNGFLLPATLTASIDEPHMALSANADFKNYEFGGEKTGAAPPP
jgi:hypothetical protein